MWKFFVSRLLLNALRQYFNNNTRSERAGRDYVLKLDSLSFIFPSSLQRTGLFTAACCLWFPLYSVYILSYVKSIYILVICCCFWNCHSAAVARVCPGNNGGNMTDVVFEALTEGSCLDAHWHMRFVGFLYHQSLLPLSFIYLRTTLD